MSSQKRWRQDRSLCLAILLHNALSQRPAHIPSGALSSLTQHLLHLRRHLASWELAGEKGWSNAQRQMQKRVSHALQDLQRDCQQVLPYFEQSQGIEVSSARAIHQDLRQLQQEFAAFCIEPRPWRVCVITEPVELEGIDLGRFRIELDVSSYLRGSGHSRLFSCEALDPAPAASTHEVTHPHVRDGELCLGDANMPLKLALSQGRLFDAFALIDRTLHTYNAHLAYVALDEWSDVRCDDCGSSTSPDELYSCTTCGSGVCGDCETRCHGCEDSFCRSCVKQDLHDEYLCADCRGSCQNCSRYALHADLDEHDGLCDDCWEEAQASDSDNTEETSSVLQSTNPFQKEP